MVATVRISIDHVESEKNEPIDNQINSFTISKVNYLLIHNKAKFRVSSHNGLDLLCLLMPLLAWTIEQNGQNYTLYSFVKTLCAFFSLSLMLES